MKEFPAFYFFNVHFFIFTYLEVRAKSVESKRVSMQACVFHLLVHSPAMARAGPDQNQELGTPSGSPQWVAGAQATEPPSAAF